VVCNRTREPVVLVIDDEESMREGCRQALEAEGYRAMAAGDGEQGLRLVEQLRPSVALVDLRMPRVSGMEVLAKIREMDPSIALIVITAYGTVESAVASMKLGAFDYLCKPFDERALLGAVRRGVQFEEASSNQENGLSQNAGAIIEVLERAHRDDQFIVDLTEQGSKALDGYGLTWEEKAAIAGGDIQWVERHVGTLTEEQKTWLNCRLQQERW